MLLNVGSLVIIALYTGYNIFYLFRMRDKLKGTMGSLFAMMIAFVASAAFGLVSAQAYQANILLSIALAALFAVISGFISGRPNGLQSAINSVLIGCLGAMAGVLLGVMLIVSNKVIVAADTVFLIFMFLTQKWMEWQSNRVEQKAKPTKGSKNKAKPAAASYKGTIILAAVLVVFGVGILLQKNHIQIGAIGQPQTQVAVVDEKNDLQIANIQVNRSGISPKNTEFKPKQMIKAIVNVNANAGTGLKLKSPILGIDASLNPGDNVFLMNNPQPGTYEYTVEPGGFKGTFTVK
ncbi:hypothetical protein [Paenibacillus planticolens]|uniref:EfeO-type cupredoxin-like domain-containing protein n=1 Tax=Paenibacillus planticolens TaxID=2654976 RepID=A0ABX1ZLD6_9BACL|nr:hypothetical protein [Paenibacillus planticolens]NOU99824.1 hypothetical protein [Paenibacillus planticolens]